MRIKKINRCVRCMRELKGEYTFCPNCGFDQRRRNSERALPVGTVLNDKYFIGAVIGEGGFGITYAAWDMLIETRIAIKEYFPSELVTRDTTLSEENLSYNLTLIQKKIGESHYQKGLDRFVKEAWNLAKFQKQPGVVSVRDFFYENNTAYMVMEYIEGVTLNSYLKNHNEKLGMHEAFQMIEPVMKTLKEIHKEGVIHRDISPDNIMVTQDGQMKLIDFGAARFVGADNEKSLTVILKHGYAPGEQYRSNGEQGSWTDVYALSAVIYRMLTGKVPEEALKRMREKTNSVRTELRKVPELSSTERKNLEKGLAVKADKRFRTVEALYEGIYNADKRKRNRWILAVGTGIAAAALLCSFFVNTENEETKGAIVTVKSYGALEGINIADDVVNEAGDEAGIEYTLDEPENIRKLREYYNENCVDKTGKVYFVDLTGDGEDEMIVTEMPKGWEEIYHGNGHYTLRVYQSQNNMVKMIYEMDQLYDYQKGIDFYLSIMNEEAFLLARHWEMSIELDWGVDEHTTRYLEKISFKQNNNGIAETLELTQAEAQEQWRHSLLLLDLTNTLNLSESRGKRIEDYQKVLEGKEGVADAIKIAENAGEEVLDYAMINDNNVSCIFAVTGKLGEYLENIPASVWALYNEHIEKVKILNGDASNPGRLSGCDIFQFGNNRHYIAMTYSGYQSGMTVQHKFCFENGQVRETDKEYLFTKDENGKIQIEVDGYIETFGESNASVTGYQLDSYYVDMFYYDGQYVEYGAEQVDNKILEQFENYNDILQSVEEEFLKGAKIGIIRMGDMDYTVEKAELDNIRRTENNVYYLNYKVYGTTSFWDIYTGEGEELNIWAHAVLEAVGGRLEFKGIVWNKREEESGLGFPLYYGVDKELKKADRS